MSNPKAAIAKRMNALADGMDSKARELAESVKDGSLTMDEAVAMHVEAEKQLRQELNNRGTPNAEFSKLLIQQAMDGIL